VLAVLYGKHLKAKAGLVLTVGASFVIAVVFMAVSRIKGGF
jgi:hypothetical protein